jgi:SAM-dependent methyltransferase
VTGDLLARPAGQVSCVRMDPRHDAYGWAMYELLHKGDTAEILERDDGYIMAASLKDYAAPYPRWPPHHRRAMKEVRGRVLDIGCGLARHALYLQRKGFDVLGVDNSPLAIRAARERGLKRARVISITQLTRRLGVFDTILMLGNNFGLFGNFRRARWLLRRFCGFTSDTARIIAESNDVYQTTDLDDLAYHAWNRGRGRMGGQMRFRVRYRTARTPWTDYLMVSPVEMRQIVDGTGWTIRRFIRSRDAGYIAVIEKTQANRTWPRTVFAARGAHAVAAPGRSS